MNQVVKDFINTFNHKGYEIKDVSVFKSGQLLTQVGNNSLVNLHSCGKTITAIAFGIAQQMANISVNDIAINYFPEYKSTAFRGADKIRIKDLLQMNAGKKLQSLREIPQQEKWAEDWLAWFFEAQSFAAAGEAFSYSSHCCYVIGRIVEKLTCSTIEKLLEQYLWRHLGIKTPQWDICPQGHTLCAGNIWLTNESLSKIGLLLLNNGEYNGKKILPPKFIQQMLTDRIKSTDPFSFNDIECTCGYGYFIWKGSRDNTYRIWGAGGNLCIIDFSNKICFTVTATVDLDKWRYNLNDNDIVRAIYKIIDAKLS